MEEEDELALLDYRTPKGQLIKLLEQKMKKPEIDDSLGKVLDQFMQITNEQTTFLENGIFQMNFAEDALLLQSCGQYYGKRVDKLWDELLQFHTRMVKYDETTAKNCTDGKKKEARKLELAKLEERLNRGKRKKISLAEPETDTPENGCYVLDIDQNAGQELFDRTNLLLGEEEEEEQAVPPFDYNFEIFDDWHEIHRIDEIERKKRGSVVVSQYNRQKFRLKNYIIPNGEEMIYDSNDPEEFNTREGRLISVHHIRHLFEYNDRCLLPDEDFTIAKLRFAYVLKKKWLIENKIDPDAPYETYKAEYEKFQREYFENEKRKIQNMPQRNSEDLMKFYKALEKKEQLARQDQEKLRKLGVKDLPEITFQSLILDPLKEGYKGDYDPYIPLDDDSPPEESVPIPPEGDHEVELSNLFVDLPQLPDSHTDAADKLRSDSGYFDGGFEADDESDHDDNTEPSVPGTDTPFEFDKDNTESKGNDDVTIENIIEKSIENSTMEVESAVDSSVLIPQGSELTENVSSNTITTPVEGPVVALGDKSRESGGIIPSGNDIESTDQDHIEEEGRLSTDNETMIREIKEFIKLGTVDEDFNYSILENSYFKKNDDMIMILYNKEGQDEESINDDSFDEIIDIGESFEKQVTKKSKKELLKTTENSVDLEAKNNKEKDGSKKRKLEECSIDDPLPKRRKLSVKQILKLKRSLIKPVNEPKWESFFSMNYQPESGEGNISRIDYESASEDEDNMPDDLLDNHDDIDNSEEQDGDKIEDLNVSGYHSDHDGSHLSDHDYCRPESPSLPPSQDSGIGNMDISTSSLTNSTQAADIEPETTLNYESGLGDFSNIDLIAELSKNTGVSCEELAKQQQPEKSELTQYEKQREEVRERVAEWKDYIQPKLKNLDENDFDIHEYGSNIMKDMDVNQSKPFSELVAGKSSAEVVRYFISSLQLANTMNVEICGAKKGELSNDSFELKLLSKERYHEHFQEYQAPSEENLREKLKKVKQIRLQNKVKQSQKKHRTANDSSTDLPSPQLQPPNIIRRNVRRSNTSAADSSNNSQSEIMLTPPSKKIKILNYNIMSSTSQKTPDFQLPSPTSQQNLNFQQPTTSWQADILERQIEPESVIAEITSPIAQTPTRSSIDSGFMPSCDEDFLDQFDQLQQITDTQLRSTPLKPRKVLRVSFARTTNF